MAIAELAGFRVFYEEHGRGDPVLLINGLGADHTAWGPVVEGLEGHFRVVVFDNPGVGQTSGPRGPYTSELFADVAAGLLRHLDIDKAHVVGASMGGIIAQQVALRHPGVTRSLALHCTWARCDAWMTTLWRSFQALAPGAPQLDFWRTVFLFVFTPRFFEDEQAVVELERGIRESPYPQSPESFIDQAVAGITHDAHHSLGAIDVPTQIGVGEHDLLTPPRYSYALAERMPGATFHLWPEMGHAPFWERVDEFNELNRNFLASC